MGFDGKIGIVGAGSWGIALGVLMSDNNYEVTVWSAIGSSSCLQWSSQVTCSQAHHRWRYQPQVDCFYAPASSTRYRSLR